MNRVNKTFKSLLIISILSYILSLVFFKTSVLLAIFLITSCLALSLAQGYIFYLRKEKLIFIICFSSAWFFLLISQALNVFVGFQNIEKTTLIRGVILFSFLLGIFLFIYTFLLKLFIKRLK